MVLAILPRTNAIIIQGVGRMLPTDRIVYFAITERAPLKHPGGARLRVGHRKCRGMGPTQPMPRTVLTPPAGGGPVMNTAIADGCWSPAVLAINGSALAAYPAIVRAAIDRNWEFIGHGYTQRNMQKVEDERADIRKTREVIAKATGKPPRGWLGPGLTETWDTPDLLVEEGYDYVAD